MILTNQMKLQKYNISEKSDFLWVFIQQQPVKNT